MIAKDGSATINLLDANAKRDLKAARLNVVLATYCVIVGIALICVVLLILFSHWWLTNKTATANTEQAEHQSQTSSYDSIRGQAATFSSNLGKIQSVLNNRSHYNTALLNIAASLPAGASVNNIALTPTFLTTPLQIIATTPTNQAALALKEKLSASPIYSKVTLDSVNCGGTNGNNCAVSLTATLNQKVFIVGATE